MDSAKKYFHYSIEDIEEQIRELEKLASDFSFKAQYALDILNDLKEKLSYDIKIDQNDIDEMIMRLFGQIRSYGDIHNQYLRVSDIASALKINIFQIEKSLSKLVDSNKIRIEKYDEVDNYYLV